MPLYEYICDRCHGTFEVIQKFSDDPLTVHEGCGGAVERLISAPALQFKGTGWYVTDYGRNGKSSSGNGSKEKPASKTDAKPESSESGKKSETKPAPASKP